MRVIYPAGTVLTRKVQAGNKGDEVSVVGNHANGLVVTSTLEFGPNFSISAADVRENYTTDMVAQENVTTRRVAEFTDPGPSPEEVFSGQAAASPGIVTDKPLRDDAVAQAERGRVDTGRPVVHTFETDTLAPVGTPPADLTPDALPTEPVTPALGLESEPEVTDDGLLPGEGFAPTGETVDVSSEPTA